MGRGGKDEGMIEASEVKGKEKWKIKGTDKKCQDIQVSLNQYTEEGENQMNGRGSSTLWYSVIGNEMQREIKGRG